MYQKSWVDRIWEVSCRILRCEFKEFIWKRNKYRLRAFFIKQIDDESSILWDYRESFEFMEFTCALDRYNIFFVIDVNDIWVI